MTPISILPLEQQVNCQQTARHPAQTDFVSAPPAHNPAALTEAEKVRFLHHLSAAMYDAALLAFQEAQ